MTTLEADKIARLVEPERVHKSVYTDPDIFRLEMERIWRRAWIYVGHASQIKNPGDYITTTVGLEPVIMVRGRDGTSIHVLYNRCAHKGATVTGKKCGHVKGFRCPYHGWTYRLDGSLQALPHKIGYQDTRLKAGNPEFSLKPVARVDDYKGFLFVRLDEGGPDLVDFLGVTAATIDNMLDRSPEGEVEIAGGALLYHHDNNWKMFIENLNDAMHPMVAHASVGDACRKHVSQTRKDGAVPPEAEIIFPFASSYPFFDEMGVTVLPYGHSYMGGRMSIHTAYSDIPGYWESMVDAYGEARAKEILSSNRHNTVCYPSFTVKDAVQAIRVVRPIAVDKTLIESWTFRLKGAPKAMLQRTIRYSRLINSPGSLVGPDDWSCYYRMQQGLAVEGGGEWVDLSRYSSAGERVNEGIRAPGTSDISMRNQFAAWRDYMTGEAP